MQANHLLEFTLHLEKLVVELKIDALHMWNVALAGTASGNLLSLIENAYGYPESHDSILRGQLLETVEREFTENDPHVDPTTGMITKEKDMAEASGDLGPQ